MNTNNINIAEVVFASVGPGIVCASALANFYTKLGRLRSENRELEMEIESEFNAAINAIKREAFMIGWSLARKP